MYLQANLSFFVTLLFVPIRPGRRDPDDDELDDVDD
jgi:hypothetical protein